MDNFWFVLCFVVFCSSLTFGERLFYNRPMDNTIRFESSEEMILSRQRRAFSNETENNSNHCRFDFIQDVPQNCSMLMDVRKLGLHPWFWTRGSESHWRGGPSKDSSEQRNTSGYAIAHMSSMISRNYSVWIMTKQFPPTGGSGKCLTLKYSSNGLNTKELEILLVQFNDFKLCQSPNTTKGCRNDSVIASTDFNRTVLWSTRDSTLSNWKTSQTTFSRDHAYHIAVVSHANNKYPDHRGYIAIDELALDDGPCKYDCLFDRDFCDWSVNTSQPFQWKLVQSTNKLNRGPSRDQSSTLNKERHTGSYAYMENSYPRRGGDKAQIISELFPPTASPVCFRFWSEIRGTNCGILRILKTENNGSQITREVWSKKPSVGEIGWYPSQVTLSSDNNSSFKIIIEGEISQPISGGIAIDTLTFEPGSCPVIPHTSGKGMSVLDCSFDVGSCSWTWIQPVSLTTTFAAMVLKVSESDTKMSGHSWHPSANPDSYVMFDFSSYKHRVRDSGYLVSPTLLGRNESLCLSFWAYMNSNVFTDPIVGAMSVIMRLSETNITIWRLANKQYSDWFHAKVPVKANQPFQLMIKGTKGSKRGGIIAIDDIVFYHHECKVEPAEAKVSLQDCSFDDNACGWKVESMSAGSKPPSIEKGWRYTGKTFGLSVVYDHTYSADNAGYVYLESFNEEVLSSLVSPLFVQNETLCFTFFYISLSKDDTASLSIYSRNKTNFMALIWKVTQKQLMLDSAKSVQAHWEYAQFSFAANMSQILIEAHVKTGGWALDDVRVLEGPCSVIPSLAIPKNSKPFNQTVTPLKLSKVPSPLDLKTEAQPPKGTPTSPDGSKTHKDGANSASQTNSDNSQIKTDQSSVLLPRTEINGPHYPGFAKTSFDLPGNKKTRLGRSTKVRVHKWLFTFIH